MTSETIKTHDEAQIRQLIADKASAICAKDLGRIMATTPQILLSSDAKPPFQIRGADAFRRTWETCLPYLLISFGTETRDLSVIVSSDVEVDRIQETLWHYFILPLVLASPKAG
jgi:ketosteroid isomerase-like protein